MSEWSVGTGCNGELVLRLAIDGGGLSDDEEVDDEQDGKEQVAEGGEIKRSEAKVFDWRVMGYRGGGAVVASEASTRRLATSKWWRATR